MNVHFFMRKDNVRKDGTAPISICVAFRNGRRLIPTGFAVKRADWNPATGRVRRSCSSHALINAELARMETRIEEARISEIIPRRREITDRRRHAP